MLILKNKVGFADSISEVYFVDIPEISKRYFRNNKKLQIIYLQPISLIFYITSHLIIPRTAMTANVVPLASKASCLFFLFLIITAYINTEIEIIPTI